MSLMLKLKSTGLMLVFTLLLIQLSVFTLAQEGKQSCTEEEQAELLNQAAETIAGWQSAEDVNREITVALTLLQTSLVRCNGYIFTSEQYGQSFVTDPIVFEDGIYRLVLEADPGGLTIEVTEVSGSCRPGFEGISSDEPRGESTAEMEGCIAILEFSAYSADIEWTITYEPILLTDADPEQPDDEAENNNETQEVASRGNTYDENGLRFDYPDGYIVTVTENGVEIANETGTSINVNPAIANLPSAPEAEVSLILGTMKSYVAEQGLEMSEDVGVSIGNYKGLHSESDLAGLIQAHVFVLRANESDALVMAFGVTTEGAELESILIGIIESLEIDTTQLEN